MQSSIYIHELTPPTSPVQEIGMDFTGSPGHHLIGDGSGRTTFLKSLDVLGMEWELRPECAEFSGYLAVRGSTEQAKQNAPKLEAAIGPIKRYYGPKADTPWDRHYNSQYIGRLLGTIAQKQLPALPEDATLMRTVGLLADPLGEMSNDDGCVTYYARRRNTAAVDETGHTIPLYDVRDIGGLLIDRTGRPALDRFTFSILLAEDKLDLILSSALAEERSNTDVIDAAMERLVAQDETLELKDYVTSSEETTRVAVSISREHAKHLAQIYPDAPVSQLLTTALALRYAQ